MAPSTAAHATRSDPSGALTALSPCGRSGTAAAKRSSGIVGSFLEQARRILADEKAANEVLLRGFAGWRPPPSFRDKFDLKASAIAMYPMYRGLARLVGMNVLPEMPSIEAEFDALGGALAESDFVYLHIKQTDSAGEDGDFDVDPEEAGGDESRPEQLGFDAADADLELGKVAEGGGG